MMTPNLRRNYVEKHPGLGNLRRIYVEKNPGLGNLRRIYVKFTSIYVESTSNLRRIYIETLFLATEKAWGVFLRGRKSPCGNGDTHSLGHKNTLFSYGKTLGRVFWGA